MKTKQQHKKATTSSNRCSETLLYICLMLVGILLGSKQSLRFRSRQEPPMMADLREAKAMYDNHLVTEHEYLLRRNSILGLPNNSTKIAAAVSAEELRFPTVTGTAYSPTKHSYQGGSILVSSCEYKKPHYRIVFIKTHKTASSTVTNLLHRFGYKYGLKFALPIDNMFYGWPTGGPNSIKTVSPIGLYQPPYDIYGSGHSILSDQQKTIVPFAEYITILRSPVTHFRSSFKYWMVAESIAQRGGPKGLTPEKYLESPARYEKFNNQMFLIFNSYAFDFGLDAKAVRRMKHNEHEINQFIEKINDRFAVVMITDYFTESLLLLKRRMCWPLDDVIYGAMKVSSGSIISSGQTMSVTAASLSLDPLREKVRDYNWLDAMLFDHFNRTLWEQIDLERAKGGWDEELAELRARVTSFAKICQSLNYQNEDMHRSELEKNDLSDDERLCHLSYTDSKGYCKTLKREQGAPIDEIECYAQRRQANLGVVRMPSAADDAFFAIVMRTSHGFAQQLVIADNEKTNSEDGNDSDIGENLPEGWAGENSVLSEIGMRPFTTALDMPKIKKIRRDVTSSLVGVKGLRYERNLFNTLAGPNYAMHTFLVQHPVQEFIDAWNQLQISRRLGIAENAAPISMESFLLTPSPRHEKHARIAAALRLPLESVRDQQKIAREGYCAHLLLNRLTCRLGLDFSAGISTNYNEGLADKLAETAAKDIPSLWYSQMSPYFMSVMLVEHLEASLVFFRQIHCWKMSDIAYVNVDLWRTAQLNKTLKNTPLFDAIQDFAMVDTALYAKIKSVFWQRINGRPSFAEEVALLTKELKETREACSTMDTDEIFDRKDDPTNYIEKGCLIQRASESAYLSFFERVAADQVSQAKIPASACHGATDVFTACSA